MGTRGFKTNNAPICALFGRTSESFETAGAHRRLASKVLAQENVAPAAKPTRKKIALVVAERKPTRVRYSHSHNLDPTAPDLEPLSARFREPG
jgi:hypothetical protein